MSLSEREEIADNGSKFKSNGLVVEDELVV